MTSVSEKKHDEKPKSKPKPKSEDKPDSGNNDSSNSSNGVSGGTDHNSTKVNQSNNGTSNPFNNNNRPDHRRSEDPNSSISQSYTSLENYASEEFNVQKDFYGLEITTTTGSKDPNSNFLENNPDAATNRMLSNPDSTITSTNVIGNTTVSNPIADVVQPSQEKGLTPTPVGEQQMDQATANRIRNLHQYDRQGALQTITTDKNNLEAVQNAIKFGATGAELLNAGATPEVMKDVLSQPEFQKMIERNGIAYDTLNGNKLTYSPTHGVLANNPDYVAPTQEEAIVRDTVMGLATVASAVNQTYGDYCRSEGIYGTGARTIGQGVGLVGDPSKSMIDMNKTTTQLVDAYNNGYRPGDTEFDQAYEKLTGTKYGSQEAGEGFLAKAGNDVNSYIGQAQTATSVAISLPAAVVAIPVVVAASPVFAAAGLTTGGTAVATGLVAGIASGVTAGGITAIDEATAQDEFDTGRVVEEAVVNGVGSAVGAGAGVVTSTATRGSSWVVRYGTEVVSDVTQGSVLAGSEAYYQTGDINSAINAATNPTNIAVNAGGAIAGNIIGDIATRPVGPDVPVNDNTRAVRPIETDQPIVKQDVVDATNQYINGNKDVTMIGTTSALPAKSTVDGFTTQKGNTYSIGRSTNSDFVIAGDNSISRTHAEVTNTGSSLFIQDKGSTNGVWVRRGNNADYAKVPGQYLNPGDNVKFGKSPNSPAFVVTDDLTLRPIYLANGSNLKAVTAQAPQITANDVNFAAWKQAGDGSFIPPRTIPGDNLPGASRQAINQSNDWARNHRIDEPILDGYRDGGSRTKTWNADGSPQTNPSREVIIVDKANDPVLNQTIDNFQKKIEANPQLTEKEKIQLLHDYVDDLLSNGTDPQLESRTYALPKGEGVYLGNIIDSGAGVCRHRALLTKVLGDQIGLDVSLVRGNFGNLGKHAWTEIKMTNGETLIVDPMHRTIFNPAEDPQHAKFYIPFSPRPNNSILAPAA
jgi:hypothetical protein